MHSIIPSFCFGGGGRGGEWDNFQSQILKRGDQKKNESVKGLRLGLKTSCNIYLPGGLTMFLVKKDFVK